MIAYDPRIAIDGHGDVVVLVPGLDGTGLLFYRQIPLLARSFRVASYALRDEATTMAELVGDLRRVIDLAAGEDARAIVVGESFGGALALSFALARPDRVAGLVILNSFAHFMPQIRLHAGIAALRLMPWGAMALVRRVTASRLHSPHTHRQEIDRFLQLTARASKHGYVNRLRILTHYDVRERLAEVRAPTLLLAADRDRLVPAVEQARFIGSRVPGAVVRVLEGHGHICLISPDIDLERILSSWRPDGRDEDGSARGAR